MASPKMTRPNIDDMTYIRCGPSFTNTGPDMARSRLEDSRETRTWTRRRIPLAEEIPCTASPVFAAALVVKSIFRVHLTIIQYLVSIDSNPPNRRHLGRLYCGSLCSRDCAQQSRFHPFAPFDHLHFSAFRLWVPALFRLPFPGCYIVANGRQLEQNGQGYKGSSERRANRSQHVFPNQTYRSCRSGEVPSSE